MKTLNLMLLALVMMLAACTPRAEKEYSEKMKAKTEQFKEVTLTTDLSWLSANEREIISILIDAADIMDNIFWMQAYGDQQALMDAVTDEYARQYVRIHYGPWDRLAGNSPFIAGFEDKPLGANFYPYDMTKEEFESWDNDTKTSLYTLIRRDMNGDLVAIPYSQAYREQHEEAATLLRRAAALAEDDGLRTYLEARAVALLTDDYQPSDFAWMAMKESHIDFVVGRLRTMKTGYSATRQPTRLSYWSKTLNGAPGS
jgi:hypothetical protein